MKNKNHSDHLEHPSIERMKGSILQHQRRMHTGIGYVTPKEMNKKCVE